MGPSREGATILTPYCPGHTTMEGFLCIVTGWGDSTMYSDHQNSSVGESNASYWCVYSLYTLLVEILKLGVLTVLSPQQIEFTHVVCTEFSSVYHYCTRLEFLITARPSAVVTHPVCIYCCQCWCSCNKNSATLNFQTVFFKYFNLRNSCGAVKMK